MLKIILADDEQFVLQSICRSIDWGRLGLDNPIICHDGIEALQAVIDESPEIVMTDIRMPGLTGLELIERIRSLNPQTCFIILSGYQDFEYARTAMQYGVRYYLVKPCSYETIMETLGAVIRDVQKQKKEQELMDAGLFAMQAQAVREIAEDTGAYRSYIQKAMSYAREHLQDPNLSLKAIAQRHLFMNPDYLSREFYHQTGEKFSAYLTRIRMDAALGLLDASSDEDRIYEIATQVGCPNAQYFSKVFKKHTGITPTEYLRRKKR